MFRLRHILLRLVHALAVLALFVLFLNALILSQQHRAGRAAALSAPPPPLAGLPDPRRLPGDEVAVIARIGASVDVALPGGTGRLFLLWPEGEVLGPAQAAVFVTPADLDRFEGVLAQSSRGLDHGAPLIGLRGTLTLPLWHDRALQAMAESGRSLAPDAPFIRPFLHGRAQGLRPSPLSVVVPALLLLAALGLIMAESFWALRRHRAAGQALRRIEARRREEAEAEALARLRAALPPGAPQPPALIRRRDALRRMRRQTAAMPWTRSAPARHWPLVLVLSAAALMAAPAARPVTDALAMQLTGRPDLMPTLRAILAQIGAWPAEALADMAVAIFGPISAPVAGVIRQMSALLWLMPLMLVAASSDPRDRSDPDAPTPSGHHA